MSNFDKYCDKLASMPFDDKVELINDFTEDIIPVLSAISEDGTNGLSLYMDFLLCAVAADGKLTEEEFALIKPLFDAAADKDISYDEAVAIFKSSGFDDSEQYKKVVDLMVDVFGLVSEDLKNEIISICLLVCAIDGEVSESEKDWIKQLVDDNFGLTPMEQVEAMLDEAGTFILATEDGDQPKMRVLGFKCVFEGKIYFAIGTFKDVYAQLVANPQCEILATAGMSFLRWDGKAVFSEDPRFDAAFSAALPQIAETYRQNGLKLAYFSIEDGSAEIVGVDNSKKKLF